MNGKELQKKIKELGFTQKHIASVLGITPQSINSIFGAKDVRTSTIERIAKACNKPLSYFIEDNTKVFPSSEPNRPINLGESTHRMRQIDPSHADIITHPIEGTTARPYYDVDFIGGFDLMMNDQTTNPTYLIDCSPYNKEGVI